MVQFESHLRSNNQRCIDLLELDFYNPCPRLPRNYLYRLQIPIQFHTLRPCHAFQVRQLAYEELGEERQLHRCGLAMPHLPKLALHLVAMELSEECLDLE